MIFLKILLAIGALSSMTIGAYVYFHAETKDVSSLVNWVPLLNITLILIILAIHKMEQAAKKKNGQLTNG